MRVDRAVWWAWKVVEALTVCTKQPQKQDVRFRQTTAAMLEVLTYTPSIAEVRMR